MGEITWILAAGVLLVLCRMVKEIRYLILLQVLGLDASFLIAQHVFSGGLVHCRWCNEV
jgi:hypothetical protein